MYKDTKTVKEYLTRYLQNVLHMAFWNAVMKRVAEFMAAAPEGQPALPTKLAAQWNVLLAAIDEEDRWYVVAVKSAYTERIALLDGQRDVLLRKIKKVVEAFAFVDIDAEKHEAALKMQEPMERYTLDPSASYEVETTQIQQWLQEQTGSAKLTKAAQTLGLKTSIEELETLNNEMRSLISARMDDRKPAEALKTARQVADTEYEYFIKGLNATILAADDESQYEPLIQALNDEIDYSLSQRDALRAKNWKETKEAKARNDEAKAIKDAQAAAKKAVKDGTWVDPEE